MIEKIIFISMVRLRAHVPHLARKIIFVAHGTGPPKTRFSVGGSYPKKNEKIFCFNDNRKTEIRIKLMSI